MVFGVSKCKLFSYKYFLLCLLPNFILTCDMTQKWEKLYHNSYQPFFFFFCLLTPGKISQTSYLSNQDIPSTSRQPLETNFCHFPHPSFPHTSFLSDELHPEMVFHLFHTSPSHSTLKPPPFLTSAFHFRHPTSTAPNKPSLSVLLQ